MVACILGIHMTSIFFSLLIFFTPLNPSVSISWHTEFERAQEEALSKDRPILMVFSGSDWCKPCIRLKQEVFETGGFKEYAGEHLSLLNIDFPRRRKHQVPDEVQTYRNTLAEQYNPQGVFPLVLILDSDGKVKKELSYKGGGLESFLREIAH